MHYQSFRAHPWHGVDPGPLAPKVLTAYVEIVPTDTVKYELDKETGILRVDRPQRYSNVCPAMYGFIPRSYCAEGVADRCRRVSGREVREGDGDPMDICILSERAVSHSDILVPVRPIGGFRLVDKGEADDKIIAILDGDPSYANIQAIEECPEGIVDRLKHYFLTYKLAPGSSVSQIELVEVYGVEEAHAVIEASFADYRAHLQEAL